MIDNRPDIPRIQKGSLERINGSIKFTADIDISNMLHGKYVRLSCARAKIKSINCTEASLIPGVVKIFTSQDFKNGVPKYGQLVMDQPILADGETKYSGDPVAMVVAENERAASAAVKLVQVEYDELPPLLTLEQAEASETSLLHAPALRQGSIWKNSNVMDEWNFKWGEIEGKERECDLVIENVYKAPFVHHFPIETPSVICLPENGGVKILTPNQNPFPLRKVISKLLELPVSMVRIKSVDMGGSFGSKGYAKLEPIAAVITLLLQRPIKITLSSEEAFLTAQREASQIRIKSGFDKEGLIVFQEIDADFLIGAYTDISPRVISKAGFHAAGPYRTPNAVIRARGIFTSTPPATAFRGFGNTHTGMALEGQMNLAAARLNIDPIELRIRNLPLKGESWMALENPVAGDWPALLRKASKAINWDTPKKEGYGRGIAFGLKGSKPASRSLARVVLHGDSSCTVFIGTTEMGQGTLTSMSIVVGHALDIPLERINIHLGDTGIVPFDAITAASRSMVNMGNALLSATDKIKSQLRDIAQEVYGDTDFDLLLRKGKLRIGSDEILLSEVFHERFGIGDYELIGEGSSHGDRQVDHPLGGPAPYFEAVVTAVELHLDGETGQITIDKMVHVSDIGRAINPKRASGIDEGGNIMGMGIALSEQLIYGTEGQLENGSSLDYRIPSIMDIPEKMNSIFQENEDGPGPLGSKGVGEGGILAIAPAIAGAVYDVSGVYFHELPITSEKIWNGISNLQI